MEANSEYIVKPMTYTKTNIEPITTTCDNILKLIEELKETLIKHNLL